jgi:hypothetical protein
MAAGLGFKDFTTGEVLTAADVDGYLMQGIWVFANATARDAAVTSPQEGNFAYLKDTNVTTYYTGSAWANVDTTGMTNPMTTTGDTIYSSSGSTPARLGIGTAGQVLQVNSGATAPEWVTPAGGGGITLLSTTTVSSGATLTISGISTSYTNLLVTIQDLTCSGGQGDLRFKANGTNSITNAVIYRGTAASAEQTDFVTSANFSYEPIPGTNYNVAFAINIYDYANTSYHKPWTIDGAANIQSSSTVLNIHGRGKIATTSAITSLQFDFRNGQTFTGGVFKVYGVK